MPDYQQHTVAEGEDLASIAVRYRTSADKIWNDSKNAKIRAEKAEEWRKGLGTLAESPYVLEPGDLLWIPPFEPKKVAIETDKRHTFRRKGLRVKLILFLRRDGKPRKGRNYELKVEGESFSGATDGSGKIEHWIRANAEKGTLTVDPDPPSERDPEDDTPEELRETYGDGKKEFYEVHLGHLDPVSTGRGLAARLHNLGFLAKLEGSSDDVEKAIREFQREFGIRVTGTPTPKTLSKLVELHLS